MRLQELLDLFEQSRRRCLAIGDEDSGVVAGLDLEGRLFAYLGGMVVSRVNPDAFLGVTTKDRYLNPGGDGLWPAPEGSVFGYEYATGHWRVPPGLTGARHWVVKSAEGHARIRAEIDLINSLGRGLPFAVERNVVVAAQSKTLVVNVTECFECLGSRELDQSECLLAPWSLCQFDSGPGCYVRIPMANSGDVWDLYDPSDDQRSCRDGICTARTDGSGPRYQIGLAPEVEWLEYVDSRSGLRVRRTTDALADDVEYIDIADRPPTERPGDRAVRFSVYSDPGGFMEIEAAGGAPRLWGPGSRSELVVRTEYSGCF